MFLLFHIKPSDLFSKGKDTFSGVSDIFQECVIMGRDGWGFAVIKKYVTMSVPPRELFSGAQSDLGPPTTQVLSETVFFSIRACQSIGFKKEQPLPQ